MIKEVLIYFLFGACLMLVIRNAGLHMINRRLKNKLEQKELKTK